MSPFETFGTFMPPEAAPRESPWDLQVPAGLVVARQVEAGNGKLLALNDSSGVKR